MSICYTPVVQRQIETFSPPAREIVVLQGIHHWTITKVALVVLMLIMYITSVVLVQVAAVALLGVLTTVSGNYSSYVSLNIATSIAAVSIFVVPVMVILSWIGDRHGWGLWNLILFTYGVLFVTTLVAISFLVSASVYSPLVRTYASFWTGFSLLVVAEIVLLVLLIISW